MKYTIREAKKRDAHIIAGFQQAMAMEIENMILDSDIIFPGVKAVFNDPSKGQYYVAFNEKEVVASLLITTEWSDWRNSYIWWFQSVYVRPEHRRAGIFRKMYEFVKKKAIEAGIPGLRLYVEKENTRAQQTYETLGMDGDHYRFYEWFK